jgi:hypothetical protein
VNNLLYNFISFLLHFNGINNISVECIDD